MNWKNLIIAVVAVIATFVFPLLSPYNPPFDEAGFVAIVTWLIGLLLAAGAGYAAKAACFSKKRGLGDSLVKQLIALLVMAVVAVAWPAIAQLSPPFDSAMFSDILNWILCLIASAVFGWNLKALKSRQSSVNAAGFGGPQH